MWWHLLLQCIESDESEARAAEGSRRQLIEERDVTVRRETDAWFAAHGREHVSSINVRKRKEAVGQRTTKDRRKIAQWQRSEWPVGAFNIMKRQRAIGKIPDMLTCWRRSVQLVSVVGESPMTPATVVLSERQLRKQRRKWMRDLVAVRWIAVQQVVVRCSVNIWGQQMEQERERRVGALVGAIAYADVAWRKGVWLRLLHTFWLQCNNGADGWQTQKRRERGPDGSGEGKGDAAGSDIGASWTQCGWGGCCMEAGTIYCRKCEWQCKQWYEAAESQTLCSIAELDQM